MSEPINNGELLLPVCIPESEITDILSALDLYRVLRKQGRSYVAFDAVVDAVGFIDAPETAPCLPNNESSAGCFRMDMTTEIVSFRPNNPFDRTDEQKTSLGSSWVRFGDIVEGNTPEWLQSVLDNQSDRIGYFANDVFIRFDNRFNPILNPVGSFNDFLGLFGNTSIFPFPEVEIQFSGAGEVQITFAQVPFGGAVLIVWDFQPELSDVLDIINNRPNSLTNFQLIEVNRDLVGIPPELVTETFWQQEFEDDTDHTILCIFTPSGQAEPPFVLPFGGIREIQFCGDIEVIGSETGNTYNQFNYKQSVAKRQGVIDVSTTDDFYDALVRWTDERAARWLSGQRDNVRGGINIDPSALPDRGFDIELSRTFTQGRTIEVPTGTSTEEILYGQALQVGTGFRNLVNEVLTWTDSSVPIVTIVQRLFQFYSLTFPITDTPRATDFETDLSAAIVASTDVITPVVIPEAVANFIYCGGPNKQSLYRYALSIEESGMQDTVEIAALYRLIIDNLDDEQVVAWYYGPAMPSLGFVNAPCYTFPAYEWRATPANMPSDLHLFESGERLITEDRLYRVEISGSITLADGSRTYDGAYVIDGSTANYFPSQLKVSTTGNSNRSVTLSPQPIRGTDGYKFEALIPVAAGETLKIEGVRTGGGVQTPSAGELIYTIVDLGTL